jgi:hypothetical protein
MKKIIIAIVLVISLSCIATPVFADDPTTTVDVVVVTPSDVDLDVDINAGGDVDITVDGYDIDEMATQIDNTQNSLQQFRGSLSSGAMFVDASNFGRFWDKKMSAYTGFLNDMDYAIGMLAEAQAKLIQGYTLNRDELTNLGVAIVSISDTMKALDATTSGTFNELRQRDDEIWNQLMYGAEYHLALLDTTVQEQIARINTLEAENADLKSQAEVNRKAHNELLEYVSQLRQQGIWIGAGGGLLLLVGVIWSLARKRVQY